MQTSPAIETRSLRKTFGKTNPALNGVSITIERGEMVALIGASGSGKSTLLRHLAGLVSSDRGTTSSVIVQGKVVQRNGAIARDVRRQRSRIGFVFQQFNLVGRLSVMTNVLTGRLGQIAPWRGLLGLFTQGERNAAMEALARVGILEQCHQRASTLSGGQQQRAAIARALVQGAEVILADEPIASLDPESSRRVMETLAQINSQDGRTVVVSLHQVDYAIRYCRRVIALKDGVVRFDGPTAAINARLLREIYGSNSDLSIAGVPETPDAEVGAGSRLEPALA